MLDRSKELFGRGHPRFLLLLPLREWAGLTWGVGNTFPCLSRAIITGLTSQDHVITLGLSI